MVDARAPRLRQLREDAGLTQQDLSRRAGLTQHCISQIETGKRRGTPPTLKKIAGALGIAISDLRNAPDERPVHAPEPDVEAVA